MANINKQVQNWKEAGIISDTQAESILGYEEKNRPKNLGVYSIIALGAIVICIGIISLVAANWEFIPDFVKLFFDFTILSGVGFSIYHTIDREKKYISEILIIVFSLLCLGSIGLISQIFHTGGELYEALGFWCFILLPLVLQSVGRFTKHFWLLSFLYWLNLYTLEKFFKTGSDRDYLVFLTIGVTALLFLIGRLFSLVRREGVELLGEASQFWGVVHVMVSTIAFSAIRDSANSTVNYFVLSFFIATSLFLFYSELQEGNKKATVYLSGMILYLLFASSHLFGFSSQFLDATLFVAVWFALAFYFNILGKKKLFEFAITVIGIRFLAVYFQLFASLALTGVGLIISGIFIIFCCVSYIKYRKQIFGAIEGIL